VSKYKVTKTKNTLPALKKTYDARAKYDWISIRKDYIEGMDDGEGSTVYPTHGQLIEKYGVPEQSLRNRASQERWEDHRQAHKREITIVRQKEMAKKLAKKAVAFDEQAADGAIEAMRLIEARLPIIKDIQEWDDARRLALLEQLENGEVEMDTKTVRNELRPMVSSSEFESLAKAYALFQDVGRKALGLTDGESAINSQVTIEVSQLQNPVAQEMVKDSDARGREILRILKNKNLRLPGYTDVVDAEVINEGSKELTDGSEQQESLEIEGDD